MSADEFYFNVPEDSVLYLLIGEASLYGRFLRFKRWFGNYYNHIAIVLLSAIAVVYLTVSSSFINSELLGIKVGALVNYLLLGMLAAVVSFYALSPFILQTRVGRSKGAIKIGLISPENGGRNNRFDIDMLVKRHFTINKDHRWYSKVMQLLDEKGELKSEVGKDDIFNGSLSWKKHLKDSKYQKYITRAKASGGSRSSDVPLIEKGENGETVVTEISALALIKGLGDINVHVIDFTSSFEYNGKKQPGIIVFAEGNTLEELLPGKNEVFAANGVSFGNIPMNSIDLIPVSQIDDVPVFILGSTKYRNLALCHLGEFSYSIPGKEAVTSGMNLIHLYIARSLQKRVEQLENEKKIMFANITKQMRDKLGWGKMLLFIHRLMQAPMQPKIWLYVVIAFIGGFLFYPIGIQWLEWVAGWINSLWPAAPAESVNGTVSMITAVVSTAFYDLYTGA